MLRTRMAAISAAVIWAIPAFGGGGWVEYNDETATRMPTPLNDPSLSTNDTDEKDYAWADLDNDGDIDLVVVRKQPFTSTGKRINVLFMNEGTAEGHAIDGVLVDRTAEYASASDVSGDEGFLTATNDRDIGIADLNGDGWKDMVTATTLTDNQAKHLSHPRVYMNLGEIDGVWQGFRHEDARIPQMHATAGPRFCSVSAGDVTGDGFPDLYFGDYDSGGTQIFDYNNRLLINDGSANFTDETAARLTSQMSEAAFGAASIIADINNDGPDDIVKQTSLNSPTHVAITYNNTTGDGFFDHYDTIYDAAPYFVSVGDLNGDGRLDLVIVDDGTDRYMLNTGNDANGHANWSEATFPSAASAGFGGNSFIADLNDDGFSDVLITDVDVDIPGCSRRMHIYRNLGNTPFVTFEEQGSVIPNNMLEGTHDVAVFDIDGDGRLDLVIGRCTGTQVWMGIPPSGLIYTYPSGLPAFLTPDDETEFDVQITVIGEGAPVPGSGQLFVSENGGAFAEVPLLDLGDDLYRATLPALPCSDRVDFYFSAELEGGGTFSDPSGAPDSAYGAVAATGTEIAFRDEIEGDVSGWTVVNENLDSGAWEAAEPNGTLDDGTIAAPFLDATGGAENVKCFVTQNGPEGGSSTADDVDRGPTYLVSPSFDLTGTDAIISYARWFYCDDEGVIGDEDEFKTWVSNDDGVEWTLVPEHTTTGTSDWEFVSFIVGNYVAPSDSVRVRFEARDNFNNSITEAGMDNFQVETFLCGEVACVGDIDGDGSVAFGDLVQLLSAWGPCDACEEDLDGSGTVGFGDLVLLLSAFGPCP